MKEIIQIIDWSNKEVYHILENGDYEFPVFVFYSNDDFWWVLYRRLDYHLRNNK